VAYAMIDLRPRGSDLRRYVHDLEEWIIRALARFNVRGERRAGRVGIWVVRDGGREGKIAAIGVRVRRWIAYHGIAVNLDPDLGHFQGIVPCGIESGPESDYGVTSLHDLGILASMAELDMALKGAFAEVFETSPAERPSVAAQ
jgi:lipoyl(octanoyl) transferase